MKNISILKSFFLAFLIIICILTFTEVSHSGSIVVKPGKFDHFGIQLPERVRAGEGFVVKLQAFDTYDNLITDFGDASKDFKVSVTGSAQAQPLVLNAVSFMGGTAVINIIDRKAEVIKLSIFESGGTMPVMIKEVIISSNKLDHFLVQSPQSVMAGNSFDVRIFARDAFDNPISDTEIDTKNIKITSSGTANFKRTGATSVFKNGTCIVALMAEKVGESVIEAHDINTGSKGVSPSIKIIPATLSHFKIFAPKEAVAGEPFEITISAYDAFDNIVDNYASYGSGVNIGSTGEAKISPSFVGQTEFRNGQAIVRLKYEKAEEISIVATENNRAQQGKSATVRINPSAPENFVVVTPDSAVAGQKFRIKVEAYDRFNNMIKHFNLMGKDVHLDVTGSGALTPKIVSASEFIDGVASLDVIYDKAESFTISASLISKREEKKITTLSEQKEEIPVATGIVEKLPTPKPKQAEKQKIEKQIIEEKHAPKAAEKPEPEKQAVPTKEEKIALKKTETKEPAKEKKAKEIFFEIKKVSLIEAKNKAMVIVTMKVPDGQLEFKSDRESLYGKEWIKISLRPAVNRTKNLWKFKSLFVKDIHIEEEKGMIGIVNIKVEVLSKKSQFDINKVKDSLVISITNPEGN